MNKNTLPQGMHDKLFKRARASYEIERTISDLLIKHHFYRIETPTLEHFEVFSSQVKSEHYHLFDQKGALLALRPDITSQIGRLIASTRVEPPIKFSYSGKVFRHNEAMRGLENERTQAGIEIVGYPAQEALEYAVLMAKMALDACQVKTYQFEFSHARILSSIFDSLKLSETQSQKLLTDIKDKNITQLQEFTQKHPSSFDTFIQELPFLFGPSAIVLKHARSLVYDEAILDALVEIEQLIQNLSRHLGDVNLDLAQVPTMPYYTGLMFKVFDNHVPDAFLSGGQYDKLFERFGSRELTAVGWAIDIESVYQAIYDRLIFEGGSLDD